MATPAREKLAKKLLNSHESALGNNSVMNKRRHSSTHAARPQRGHRLQQLPSPTEQQLQQRESGWNDRFFYEPPINSNKLPRPSNNTPISPQKQSAAARQRKNEKKVREERLQYGKGLEQMLASIAYPYHLIQQWYAHNFDEAWVLLHALHVFDFFNYVCAAEKLHPSKEEKLRIKALKAIDARENLLYQLNALILCTPAQETLFQPSRPADPPSSSVHSGFQRIRAKAGMALALTPSSRSGTSGAMTNSREATKLAQKLAEDLQLAGIQCVEAIVEWMLQAGAKAEKPPPFLWRERNYFLKMYNDLDFAQAELEARGVYLECYTQQNPLLIRTNQKLGRVLAAQAIITEMVEMATTSSKRLSPVALVDHGFEKHPEDSNILNAVDSDRDESEYDAQKTSGSMNDLAGFDAFRPPEPERADMMILQHSGDGESEEAESEGDATARGDDQDQEDEYASEEGEDDASTLPSSHEVDALAADELVHILDESFNGLVRPSIPFDDQGGETAMLSPMTTAREDVRSSSEYDNSFEDAAEADTEDENQQTDDNNEDEENVSSPLEGKQKENHENEPEVAKRLQIVGSDESTINQLDGPNDDNQQSAELQSSARNDSDGTSAIEKEDELDKEEACGTTEEEPDNDEKVGEEEKVGKEDEPATLSRRLLEAMKQSSSAAGCTFVEDPVISIDECLSWTDNGTAKNALANHEPINRALFNSFYAALGQYQLSPTIEETQELLRSQVAQEVQLEDYLSRECLSIVDNVYDYLASQAQESLERGNSLISEIEIDEVVELTEATFIDFHLTTWVHLRNAVDFLKLMHSNSNRKSVRCTSWGVSNLVKVFYPYLVNLPREKLSVSWRRIAHLFNSVSPDLDGLLFLMDPTCKALLLAASSRGSLLEEDESDDEDGDERTIKSFPKLTLVCQRGNVLETSMTMLWSKLFNAKESSRVQHVVYPFFQSSFGEKVVDGLKVEEGEGKGPLKEWIVLITREMAAKWKDISIDSSIANGNASVKANGNKLTALGLARNLQTGFELSWASDQEEAFSRVINKIVDADTVLLDRGVSTYSFSISDLKVRQPKLAFLEYIQASESFWLNSQTSDTFENRRVLYFYGWYLGVVISHYSKIDLPLHELFFSFLLNEDFKVALDDVRSLDPSLYGSLVQLKQMSPSDFAAYLDFEGISSNVSVDDYIAQVVDEKFGSKSSIRWQFGELRAGFQRVFLLDELRSADVEAKDLAKVICGSPSDLKAQDSDFNLDEIFRVALDPDFVKCLPLRRVFWRVVNAFGPRLKRKLVKFITGVDTLPLPGTEFLRIEMPFAALTAAENEKVLLMLPQSHTCDNTLELPHYWRALCWKKHRDEHLESEELEDELAALLTKKLEDAVEYSSGYGLDGTSTVSGIFPEKSGKQPGNATSRSDLVKEESYESLDLPGIGDSVGPSSRAQTPSSLIPQTEEALLPLPQETELLPAEMLDEPERLPILPSSSLLTSPPSSAAPTSAETLATVEETMVEPSRASAASSPAKSARPPQRNDDDESYAENDWEEEEELLEE